MSSLTYYIASSGYFHSSEGWTPNAPCATKFETFAEAQTVCAEMNKEEGSFEKRAGVYQRQPLETQVITDGYEPVLAD
jgi:hypothetical protein